MKATEELGSGIGIRGFGRMLAMNVETGKIEGERRWHNVVPAIGIRDFLVKAVHSDLSGSLVRFAGLGSATTAPTTDDTALNNEFETRKDTTGTLVASRTMRSTWSYATNEATQSSVGEVGLFRTDTAGAMFSHATFTQSLKTTNQTLAFTYDIVFQTSS